MTHKVKSSYEPKTKEQIMGSNANYEQELKVKTHKKVTTTVCTQCAK